VIRQARRAVTAVFFVNGAVIASWVPHIPAVKSRHALSDGQLGVVLLAMAVGSVLSLPVAGRLVGRFGSRAMTTIAGVALCLALPLPVLSGQIGALALSLIVLGAANGLLDVSMNTHALAVERRYERPIMSSFHAFFSLGGAAGAALAGLGMWLGVEDTTHVVVTAALGVLIVLTARRRLLVEIARDERPPGAFGWPAPPLLFLGLLAFAGLLAEGAIADWGAVYLHASLAASSALAATGFAAFSLAMTMGRLAGDRIVARFGAVHALRMSGAVAAGGLGAALLIDTPLAAVVGFGLVGLGIANVIPVLFSAAGQAGGNSAGSALAAVATPGYLGFLAGPPLIGLAAENSSLRVALGIVCAVCALVSAGAGRLARTV
jgi:MFS family permease